MDLTKFRVIFGFIAGLLVIIITLHRQRRLEAKDFHPFAATFFGGTNIPIAIFLCYYGLDPDPPSVATKLRGYEYYISFTGFFFLLLNVYGIWLYCKSAYDVADSLKEEVTKEESVS